MEIRQFGWDDFDGVTALWGRTGRDAISRRELEVKLERDPELFLVASVDGEIAGVVLGTFDGRRGWIFRLAVDPDRRRGGIASKLVDELEGRFRGLGCPRVNLIMLPGNREAVAFWAARGYITVPELLATKPM